FAEAADANAWLSSIEGSLREGDWRPPELAREKFVIYGQRWLEQRVDLRPRTRELYESLWRRWLKPAFPDITIGAMTPETWRAWHLKMTTENPGSLQPAKAYRLARAILNTAVDDGTLKSNPCRVKGAGKEKSPERPVVTPEVVRRISNNITPRYRLMVLLAAFGQLRFGELAGLRRRRVDVLHRQLRIEEAAIELGNGRVIFGDPKSEKGKRPVAFPGDLVPLLEAHLTEFVGADDDALLFTSPEGHPLRRTKFRSHLLTACKRAGVVGLHLHDLRHSGLTWSAEAGATTAELMHRGGHSDPRIALRYQHATVQRDKDIAARLGEMYRNAAVGAEPAEDDHQAGATG
ncbi:MAG TPA: site-specific integrase, partial [Acidimicrobiales bacterium]|nr:site-specific integrase [Acidimicrobiales bacterium]